MGRLKIEDMPKSFEENDLATIVYPADRYPAAVVARTSTTITLAYLNVENLPEHARRDWTVLYQFEPELVPQRLTTHLVTAYLSRKSGKYFINTVVPVMFGRAVYYRDFAD